jgi:hypothetical protein
MHLRLFVLISRNSTAETAGEEEGKELDADQNSGHNYQPFPLLFDVTVELLQTSVGVDSK